MFNKKNVVTITLSMLASLFVATSASAAVNGPYLGGGLGWGTIHNTDFDNAIQSSLTNNNGLAGRVFGGVQLNQNFGLEAGFTKFSDFKGNGIFATDFGPIAANETVKTYAIDLVGKGTLPLQNGFSLFGKLGVAYINEQASATATDGFDSLSDTSTTTNFAPTFGLGLGYDINKNVTADVSWMRIQQVGDKDSTNNSTDTAMLNLTYHIG